MAPRSSRRSARCSTAWCLIAAGRNPLALYFAGCVVYTESFTLLPLVRYAHRALATNPARSPPRVARSLLSPRRAISTARGEHNCVETVAIAKKDQLLIRVQERWGVGAPALDYHLGRCCDSNGGKTRRAGGGPLVTMKCGPPSELTWTGTSVRKLHRLRTRKYDCMFTAERL